MLFSNQNSPLADRSLHLTATALHVCALANGRCQSVGQPAAWCAGQMAGVVSRLRPFSHSKCQMRENWETDLTYKTISVCLLWSLVPLPPPC